MQNISGWQLASVLGMVVTFHTTKSETLLEVIKTSEKDPKKKPERLAILKELYHLKLRIETKMEAETLEEFIKLQMTAADYEKLPDRLGISQHKLTRIFNRPQEASLDEVLNLAAMLTVAPTKLIDAYEMGFNHITLDEYARFKAMDKAA